MGPDEDFYSLPPSVPEAEPGRLVRLESLQSPPGVQAWRVLYHSTAVDGRDVVVSGLVFAPEQPGEPGSRPVVAWAHGSVGLGDRCAPSRHPDDLLRQPILSQLLADGFVIAATDYEGLGTPGPHPWLVGLSEGRGVIDSVRAAALIPETGAGSRFAALGASQGGGAALFAGELASDYAKELELLGVVAAAPAAELDLLALLPDRNLTGVAGFVVMGALGFHAAYPNLPLDAILSPSAISQKEALESLCQLEIERRFRGISLDEYLKASPATVDQWLEVIEQNTPGRRRTPSPVLLLHGEEDRLVPPETTLLLFQRLCSLEVKTERRVYTGIGHIGVVEASASYVLEWINERVAGREPSPEKAQQNCL